MMQKPGKSKTLCNNVEDHRIWRFNKGFLAVFLVSGGVVLQLPCGRYIVQKCTRQKGEGVDYLDQKLLRFWDCICLHLLCCFRL
jgi:hypothetical protein